jgi:hypothetical protein
MRRKFHMGLDQQFPEAQLYQQGLQEGDRLQQQRVRVLLALLVTLYCLMAPLHQNPNPNHRWG